MRTVGTVIARGGSIRLPRKNVRPFCGLPLVAWTIIQARCSRLIDEVWLSTDDDEIQEVGEEFGAIVVRRPDWPDADTASGLRPFLHLLQTIIERTGDIDCVVATLPTDPLRLPDQLDRLVARFYEVDDITKTVLQMIQNRETLLFEEVGDEQRLAVFDKNYRYSTMVGGTGSSNPAHVIKTQGQMVDDSDAAIDAQTRRKVEENSIPTTHPHINLEPWQNVEVDTLEEFELAQVIMEHYILKGRGERVYYDYRDSGVQSHPGPKRRNR